MSLSVSDFSQFFDEVHTPEGSEKRYQPFPWQQRLLEKVLESGWPQTIGVPTASGKTASLDVGIFALALDGGVRLPRRLFFVVDRRIVVDQTFQHALQLQQRIRDAKPGSVCALVRERLTRLCGVEFLLQTDKEDQCPLVVHQLRGGVYREKDWCTAPTIPTIVCSTVDQIGSRLLFRGYGVSEFGASQQAGLVGSDSQIILDEAHCSVPFQQTVETVGQYAESATSLVKRAVGLTIMSATPNPELETGVELEQDDLENAILGPRMKARKRTSLKVAKKAKGKKWAEHLAKEIHSEALALAERPESAVVAVIVNRVGTARKVYQLFQKGRLDSILLTGRMRELDREKLLKSRREQLMSGRTRDYKVGRKPFFVVATQCVEVGADFDFDGMVSECAALDALRQRFGRLDRMGGMVDSEAVIVIAQESLAGKEPDPIYGEALSKTWDFLNSIKQDGSVDMGVLALEDRLPRDKRAILELCAVPKSAPVLLPAHLDCLVQTSPRPNPDTDPSVFLRGVDSGTPDVRVLWRDDVRADTSWENFKELMSLVPPATSETLPVPLGVFKRWFSGLLTEDLSADVEQKDDSVEETSDEVGKAAFVWCGPEDERSGLLRRAYGVRPGDTIVLTDFTHLKELGDIPTNLWRNYDLGDLAQLESRRKAVLRLGYLRTDYPAEDENIPGADALGQQLQMELENGELSSERLGGLLDELENVLAENDERRKILRGLVENKVKLKRQAISAYPGNNRLGVVIRHRFTRADLTYTNQDDSANNATRVTLRDHCELVGQIAGYFGAKCGLSRELVHDLTLAGKWHDLGKADPKFQAWLYGGNATLAQGGELLAKSKQDAKARKIAKELSGYPKGKRHEFLSASWVAKSHELLGQAYDQDVVLHLITTHHGRARPLAPLVEEEGAGSVEFDLDGVKFQGETEADWCKLGSGHFDRFWRCVRKYGWWGLSYLESLLICSDHRGSQFPELEIEAPKLLETAPAAQKSSKELKPCEFPYIDGSELLGFLAALGLFRTACGTLPGTKLSWELGAVWHPVLWLEEDVELEVFVGALADELSSTEWPTLLAENDNTHKLEPDYFRKYATKSLKKWLSEGDRTEADWVSALACESATRDGFVLDTQLRTMSGAGHQHFLKTMRQLRDETTGNNLADCLLRAWAYEDDKPSLRFDPDDDRRWALRWREPSKDPVKTVRGANRLAVEAIPFFACLPEGKKLRTTGFQGRGSRGTFLDWPLWTEPLGLDAVRSLLSYSDWFAEMSTGVRELGIAEVFRSRRITVGKVRNFTPSRSRLAEPKKSDEKLVLLRV